MFSKIMGALGLSNWFQVAQKSYNTSTERLASGRRINSSIDDAAGLSISERMRSQISGLEQANRNVQDGMSFLQVVDGGLEQGAKLLNKAKELLVSMGGDTLNENDKKGVREQLNGLVKEWNQTVEKTQYNGYKPLTGEFHSNGFTIQTGPKSGDTMNVKIKTMDSNTLGFSTGGKGEDRVLNNPLQTQQDIATALQTADSLLEYVHEQRGTVGAAMNRLTFAKNSNETLAKNTEAAHDRIVNVDVAKEQSNLVASQIRMETTANLFSTMHNDQRRMAQLLLG